MSTRTVSLVLFIAVAAWAQNIATPMFVHKDGEASAGGFSGSEKDIVVDGGALQVVGWATFQTDGIDRTNVVAATLQLYVKSVTTPGTLQVRGLTAPIDAPEDNVRLTAIAADVVVTATQALGTDDVERVLRIDVTPLVTGTEFHGIALVSNDGLSAAFDSKEGRLAPMLLLTYDMGAAASQWFNGTGAPTSTLGGDGDYYLENATGDVYAKTGGVWNSAGNIEGPRGPAGPQGEQGPEGPPGPAGSFPSGSAPGDMQYWNGTQWIMIPAGLPLQSLTLSGTRVPEWGSPAGSVVDIDGNTYRTVKIGAQEWTTENLRTRKLNDGTPIPYVTDPGVWSGLTTPCYCWYGNDTGNKATYGALYNWYVIGTGDLAPDGWRVPTRDDWITLETYLIDNGYNYDDTKAQDKVAKSMAVMSHWNASTIDGVIGNDLSANNASGFSALPGGYRNSDGSFFYQSMYGHWWSATSGSSTAYSRYLGYAYSSFYEYNYHKRYGFSVRLVRDVN